MTREQIERLAEKINGKWPENLEAGISAPTAIWVAPKGNGFATVFYNSLQDDSQNAYWCIFCLDRLEELGCNPQLAVRNNGYLVTATMQSAEFGIAMVEYIEAPTRAEALALALLQKLEEE